MVFKMFLQVDLQESGTEVILIGNMLWNSL